jgi:2-keto-myo-inositol isomerase
MTIALNRRQALGAAGFAAAAGALSTAVAAEPQLPNFADAAKSVRYCLNMSTIRGQMLSVPEQVRIAAEAGYDAIEPWIGDLHKYVEQGGSTPMPV